MNDYCDRYGEPLKWGDAVAALNGSEEKGYTAVTYVVDYPSGGHILMLKRLYTFADIYVPIPTDKAELERRRLTRLGPHNRVPLEKFEQWKWEVTHIPDVDCEQVKQLKPMTLRRYGQY